MKHRVKVVGVRDGLIDLKVDGVVMTFLIDRPRPLDPLDATMLRSVLDDSFLKMVYQGASLKRSVREWLSDWWHRKFGWRALPIPTPLPGQKLEATMIWHEIATRIEGVGIEVDLDGVTCVVVRKSDMDRILGGL